jgi:uncharacterized protein
MAEYLHPGVYIEEIERGPRPIEGVPTSTSALLGEAERGSISPRLVTSYKDYQRWFGSVFDDKKFLPHAANGYFENGGKRAFVCRLVGDGATTAEAVAGDFIVRAAGPGLWGTRVKVKISDGTTKKPDGTSVGFRMQLAYWSNEPVPGFDPFTDRTQLPRPSYQEDFDDLETDETSPDFYGKRIPFVDLDKGETNQGPESSALGFLVRNAGVETGTRPANGIQVLSGGADDSAALGVDDFKGLVQGGRKVEQGLAALELDSYRDVALVYAPVVSSDIAKEIVGHCERMRFRFAVIDADKGQNNPSGLNPRNTITDSPYAAFYYPWLVTADPRTGARKLTPPGGHVLGVYARSDTERGVFKAPANEIVRGALALEYEINDQTQDDLNPRGVNVVRSFPGRGIRVWGARTITSNAVEVPQRASAVHLPRALDLRRHAVGGLRAQRRSPVGTRDRHDPAVSAWTVAAGRALGQDRAGGILHHVRPHDDVAGRHLERTPHLRNRHRAGPARGVRHLPHLPEHG